MLDLLTVHEQAIENSPPIYLSVGYFHWAFHNRGDQFMESSKSEAPSSREAPNLNSQTPNVWGLVLEVSLVLVMLGFGAFLRCQSDKLKPGFDHRGLVLGNSKLSKRRAPFRLKPGLQALRLDTQLVSA
jgi:hypothetical protein